MIASRPFRVACVQTRPGKSNMDFICLAKPVTPSPQSPRFFIARYYSHRSCISSIFPHLEQASPCIVYIFISKLQYPQGDMSQVKKKKKRSAGLRISQIKEPTSRGFCCFRSVLCYHYLVPVPIHKMLL